MDLLVDTNALLWWLLKSSRISRRTYAAIADPRTRVYVSLASAWEMAIKVAIGKLPVPPDLASWLPATLQAERFTTLPITLEHVLAVEHLPHHHRDPFDRLLIAQAAAERLTIVTGDPVFALYNVPLLRC
jgi:PIN domain nuclease of toxin-antitoxin system